VNSKFKELGGEIFNTKLNTLAQAMAKNMLDFQNRQIYCGGYPENY
jgi:hypothetical protein